MALNALTALSHAKNHQLSQNPISLQRASQQQPLPWPTHHNSNANGYVTTAMTMNDTLEMQS